jgi:hypothetical protein
MLSATIIYESSTTGIKYILFIVLGILNLGFVIHATLLITLPIVTPIGKSILVKVYAKYPYSWLKRFAEKNDMLVFHYWMVLIDHRSNPL